MMDVSAVSDKFKTCAVKMQDTFKKGGAFLFVTQNRIKRVNEALETLAPKI